MVNISTHFAELEEVKGKYASIIDASIDKKKNELVLLTDPSALLRFDSLGNFINSQKLPAYYNFVMVDNDYTYLENDTYANDHPTEYSITILHDGHTSETLKPLKELALYCFIEGHQLSDSSPSCLQESLTRQFMKYQKKRLILFIISISQKRHFPKMQRIRYMIAKNLITMPLETNLFI
ncbi:MAG: 6-bladed beta-propeller [Bacteroides sp.]|nr:6-bladed beta-propeller [Bacteroides sp.]